MQELRDMYYIAGLSNRSGLTLMQGADEQEQHGAGRRGAAHAGEHRVVKCDRYVLQISCQVTRILYWQTSSLCLN
jgi:hypothetical protein